jgi:ethanolamine ammonia-lyase large subunit
LGVIDHDGKPTEHFGDPIWVYQAYLRALGDTRSEAEIRADGQAAIARVRTRGVFLSERYGTDYSKLPVDLDEHVHRIYDDAKKCIWAELPANFESLIPNAVPITTRSIDRNDYILHPIGGEELSEESASKLSQLSNQYQDRIDTVIVLSDGLNALASTTDDQSSRLIAALRKELTDGGYHVADETLIVRSGRVRAGYRIGETMFKHRGVAPQTEQPGPSTSSREPSKSQRLNMVHVIGERPQHHQSGLRDRNHRIGTRGSGGNCIAAAATDILRYDESSGMILSSTTSDYSNNEAISIPVAARAYQG